jgi:acyl-CoA thioester hydrolase
MHEPFEYAHQVRPDEIDALGRASNVAYVEWMLAAATAHSSALGWPPEAYLERGEGWVVRSHAIEYRGPAFAGDRVVVRTWVATMDGASSIRRYEMVRAAGKPILLATAETRWAFVDFRTGRPARIPREIAAAFPILEPRTSAP